MGKRVIASCFLVFVIENCLGKTLVMNKQSNHETIIYLGGQISF